MQSDNSTAAKSSAFFNSVPASGLVMIAIIAIQFGAAISVQLFPVIGVEGTVALRIILSALLIVRFTGLSLTHIKTLFISHWLLLCGFGLCIVAMNLFFYQAISRIPLGAAVAIEFIGPLAVAALNSKRIIHLFWVALAALGIFLLSPLSGVELNTAGIVYAFLAGVGWALFIVLAKRLGERLDGSNGLAIGMLIAAILMIPMAIPVVPRLLLNPLLLIACIGVAVLSTAIPFTFEFEALKRMPARAYGILVSLEPAVAALVGAVILNEAIGIQGVVAVGCVVVAAIGIETSNKHSAG